MIQNFGTLYGKTLVQRQEPQHRCQKDEIKNVEDLQTQKMNDDLYEFCKRI